MDSRFRRILSGRSQLSSARYQLVTSPPIQLDSLAGSVPNRDSGVLRNQDGFLRNKVGAALNATPGWQHLFSLV